MSKLNKKKVKAYGLHEGTANCDSSTASAIHKLSTCFEDQEKSIQLDVREIAALNCLR